MIEKVWHFVYHGAAGTNFSAFFQTHWCAVLHMWWRLILQDAQNILQCWAWW